MDDGSIRSQLRSNCILYHVHQCQARRSENVIYMDWRVC